MLPRRRFEDVSADWKTWTCVMSHHNSTQWRARAKETRILAEKMKGEISKHLMLRIAEDYERLARTVEHRPNRFAAEVSQYGSRKKAAGAPPPKLPDLELPSFLKRGPATAEEVAASV